MTPATPRVPRTCLVAFAAAALPFVVVSAWKEWAAPTSPWAYHYDPEAMYFCSGAAMLRGEAPTDVDNPGTPLQLVSAAIAAATGSGAEDFPAFVRVAHVLALLVNLTGLALLARAVVRTSGALPFVAAAWTCALFPQALARLDIWCPEAMTVGLGGAVLAALLGAIRRPRSTGRAVVAGAATGLACASKLTFLPWTVGVVLAIAVARRSDGIGAAIRGAGAATGGTVAAFLVATLPALPHWPRMFARIAELAHGAPMGLARFADVRGEGGAVGGLAGLVVSGTAFHAWLAVCLTLLVVAALRRRDSGPRRRRVTLGLTAFAVAGIVVGYWGVRGEPNFRYLLPAAVPAAACLLAASPLLSRTRVAPAVVAALVGALVVRQVRIDLTDHGGHLRVWEERRAAIADAVARHAPRPDPVVVYGGRPPVPGFGVLLFAQSEVERQSVWSTSPRVGIYDPRARRVRLPPGSPPWDLLVVEDEDLASFPEPVGPELERIGTYRVVGR